MKPDMNYTLYLCTDRRLMTTDTLEEAVELAIQGGVTVVQLREKDCTSREFYEEAEKVKAITDAYEIPLLAGKIVGATANTLEKAEEAWKSGADYLGVGDVFGTSTKADTIHVTLEELAAIKKQVEIPVVAIGGINAENISSLKATGVDGAAVISAILAKRDITAAAETLISNFLRA